MNSVFETSIQSYTFACWMKPISSAGGQGFMWGQTQRGIHNGIRNGGLYNCALGSGQNASTVLEVISGSMPRGYMMVIATIA